MWLVSRSGPGPDLDRTQVQVRYRSGSRSRVCWTWTWGPGPGSAKSGRTGPGPDRGQSSRGGFWWLSWRRAACPDSAPAVSFFSHELEVGLRLLFLFHILSAILSAMQTVRLVSSAFRARPDWSGGSLGKPQISWASHRASPRYGTVILNSAHSTQAHSHSHL